MLLIHDWDGLTDYEIKRANMLAEKGYAVFAADLYGKGCAADRSDRQAPAYRRTLQGPRENARLDDGSARYPRAKGANTGNAVAMGYCFGGSAVLELARSGAELKGFATFRRGLETLGGGKITPRPGRNPGDAWHRRHRRHHGSVRRAGQGI